MEIIDAIEPEARGIYSGALGFLGLNGTTDLSIVIRTIISTPDAMHIGAGGAITIQSDPRAEFDEMLLKAQPLMRAIATSVHGHAGPGTYHVAGGRASGLPEQLPTGTQELYRWTMVGAGEVQPDPATRSKP
jgi:para-aminobenzoate synthetase